MTTVVGPPTTGAEASQLENPNASVGPTAGSESIGASYGQLEAWNVELVGHIGGRLNAVAADENYVYLAIGPRLVVLDVSGLDAPRIVGETTPHHAVIQGLARRGSYLYATDQEGLQIIDLSDPARPAWIGEVRELAGRSLRSFYVSASFAYILDSSRFGDYTGGGLWLRIVDLSDPLNPVQVGLYQVPGLSAQVAFSGGHAYLAYGGPRSPIRLTVLDLSNPAAPTVIAEHQFRLRHPIGDGVDALGVVESTAYVLGGAVRIREFGVVDVSNPAEPRGKASYVPVTEGIGIMSAATADGLVLTALGDRLLVTDVRDPSNPVEVAVSPSATRRAAVVGAHAYLLSDGHLRIVDVSEPEAPREIGVYAPEEFRSDFGPSM